MRGAGLGELYSRQGQMAGARPSEGVRLLATALITCSTAGGFAVMDQEQAARIVTESHRILAEGRLRQRGRLR